MAYQKIETISSDKGKIMDKLQETIYKMSDAMKDASDVLVSQTNQPMVSFNRKKREIKKLLDEVTDELYASFAQKDVKDVKSLDH